MTVPRQIAPWTKNSGGSGYEDNMNKHTTKPLAVNGTLGGCEGHIGMVLWRVNSNSSPTVHVNPGRSSPPSRPPRIPLALCTRGYHAPACDVPHLRAGARRAKATRHCLRGSDRGRPARWAMDVVRQSNQSSAPVIVWTDGRVEVGVDGETGRDIWPPGREPGMRTTVSYSASSFPSAGKAAIML